MGITNQPGNGGRTSILVVDDSPVVARLVTRLFRTIGFRRVDTAQDGSTALKLLHQNEYQLVISDFQMDPMSGLELLKAIRSNWRIRETHFLMMAGGTEVDQVTAAHLAGMDGYILKPFTASALRSKIDEVFQARRARVPDHPAAHGGSEQREREHFDHAGHPASRETGSGARGRRQ